MTGWPFAVSRLFRLYPLYLPLMALVFVTVFHLQNWELKDSGTQFIGQILSWLTFDRPDVNQYHQTDADLQCHLDPGLRSVLLHGPATGWTDLYLSWRLATDGAVPDRHLCPVSTGWLGALTEETFLAGFLGGIAAAYWIRRPHLLAWGKTLWPVQLPCWR
jgi:hypothetical protein